jgi:hypothetical protein
VGHSQARILDATYEYTVGTNPPINFGKVRHMMDFPGLLSPEVNAPIVIFGLPKITSSDSQLIEIGQTFIWLRTIFHCRDDRGVVYEVRFTGRYGRVINEQGERDFRFVFPDSVVPPIRWYDFRDLRCLNVVKSEPQDLGCDTPN